MNLFKRKNRIYIFPTKMGGYLIGLLFLMFLLSVGYSNNLLLIFTLFLFGFNLLWLIQTNYHLNKLKFSHLDIADGHEGEEVIFKASWSFVPEEAIDLELVLLSNNSIYKTKNLVHDQNSSTGFLKLNKRSKVSWKHLKVSSIRPYGLYRAWIYFELNQDSFIFPKLNQEVLPMSFINQSRDGESPEERAGSNDIRNLAPYQGEEFRRISWKHYASSGELYVKEGEDYHSPLWNCKLILPTEINEKEVYLSELASKFVYCYRNQIQILLQTEDKTFGPSKDEANLKQCLRVLSIC